MAIGAVLEPLMVIGLLAFGTVINRNKNRVFSSSFPFSSPSPQTWQHLRYDPEADYYADPETAKTNEDEDTCLPLDLARSSNSPSTTSAEDALSNTASRRRRRTLRFLGWEWEVATPNTEIFKDRFLSRVLQRFPFLVEVWYWALIYWVYQLGRAFTAVTLRGSTIDTAREHALQVIHIEQRLGIFLEPAVQKWFLANPTLMQWTNRIYSFIHIPGTILFLIVLYHLTTAQLRCKTQEEQGEHEREATSYGFVDTVHGEDDASSVWTTNRFCNQYAAMPSLHFGYSFLIGLSIGTAPLSRRPAIGWRRILMICIGMAYPALILAAIVATANHFILDAVAGGYTYLLAWNMNGLLLDLLPLEDYILASLRIHKP
ncbi:hypothetical protein MFIFM68171_01684 [Madurella fahalii]|uniref:Inositolphosphotransferase Aur1/Ipt1 domain-containing protein n=1 Tax=Madurella fahalii TaxID=1157608 RepID=A0ABQ0G1D5_9PEZI